MYTHEFCVCELATEADAIIGTDFLRKIDAILDFDRGNILLKKAGKTYHDPLKGRRRESRGTAASAALAVFSHTDGHGRKKSCWVGCKQRQEQLPKQINISSPEIEIKNSDSWLVKTT